MELGGSIDGDVRVVADGLSNLVTIQATAGSPGCAAPIANT
jgi:hypothetical protein